MSYFWWLEAEHARCRQRLPEVSWWQGSEAYDPEDDWDCDDDPTDLIDVCPDCGRDFSECECDCDDEER